MTGLQSKTNLLEQKLDHTKFLLKQIRDDKNVDEENATGQKIRSRSSSPHRNTKPNKQRAEKNSQNFAINVRGGSPSNDNRNSQSKALGQNNTLGGARSRYEDVSFLPKDEVENLMKEIGSSKKKEVLNVRNLFGVSYLCLICRQDKLKKIVAEKMRLKRMDLDTGSTKVTTKDKSAVKRPPAEELSKNNFVCSSLMQ